jgi:hypothetical protein
LDPYEFQHLVADLLKAMGYFPSWVAPSGGSRQRNVMPAMEAKRTVGGRGRHSRT